MKSYDLIVVGGGGAGLCAALCASREGLSVALVTKQNPLRSQTVMAQGGINGALDGDIEAHIADTLKGGDGLCDERAVRILCEEAPDAISSLERMGVAFDRDEEGNILQRPFGGGSKTRTCYSSDRTGQVILHTLFEHVQASRTITLFHDRMLLAIDTTGKRTRGIAMLNVQEGSVEYLRGKSVVIATGGYAGIYHTQTTNSSLSTGDGIVASARAGAMIRDCEFVQFHPTTLENCSLLISEAARAEGGYLLNDKGERFVNELATRDEVSRSIGRIINEGGKVYLDMRHLGENTIELKLPQERHVCRTYAHLDPVYDLIPIKPSAHYTMGGIAVNENGETKVAGLFACGEAASFGLHGANRLGGNSLLEIVVFGERVGREASRYCLEHPLEDDYAYLPFLEEQRAFVENVMNLPCKINFYDKKVHLGKILSVNVGLFKEERYLKAVMGFIRQTQDEYPFMGVRDKSRVMNTNLVEFIEFGNMLQLAEMVVVASLNRMESRGSHYRTDFPEKNDEQFCEHSMVWLTDGVVHMEFEERLKKLR